MHVPLLGLYLPDEAIQPLVKNTRPKRKRESAQDVDAKAGPAGNPLLLIGELAFTIGFMFVAELFLPSLMHRYLGVNETLGPFIVYGLFGSVLAILLWRYPRSPTDKCSD